LHHYITILKFFEDVLFTVYHGNFDAGGSMALYCFDITESQAKSSFKPEPVGIKEKCPCRYEELTWNSVIGSMEFSQTPSYSPSKQICDLPYRNN
jgi:hypothetical protein